MCPECIEYMGLLANKVAGYGNPFLLDEQVQPALAVPASLPQFTVPNEADFIEAEYQEVRPHGQEGRRSGPAGYIGYQPMQKIKDFFGTAKRQAEAVPVYINAK